MSQDKAASTSSNTETKNSEKKKRRKTISLTEEEFKILKETMLEKFERTAPYNVFFNKIHRIIETCVENNSASFLDLLCPSLGVLVDSLHLTFMLSMEWLLFMYKERNLSNLPMTLVYGYECEEFMDIYIKRFCRNVQFKYLNMTDELGCHHPKLSIFMYEGNSIRIVVSTANLYQEDWLIYNQSFWMSPNCPQLARESSDLDGESPTGFKASLLKYLKYYELDILEKWIQIIKRADLSQIKSLISMWIIKYDIFCDRVFLLTSFPGKHYPTADSSCHIHRVGEILSKYCTIPTAEGEDPDSWPVISQSSAIGSMGRSPHEWLKQCILRTLSSHVNNQLPKDPKLNFSLIYPSLNNYYQAYIRSVVPHPYSKRVDDKQHWLRRFFCQWIAENPIRCKVMTHSKCYMRVSPCLNKMAYYILTSSNISRSAWGMKIEKDQGVEIKSYELGILFLPQFFGEEYFELKNTENKKNKTYFPLLFKLPLVPYADTDKPLIMETVPAEDLPPHE